jgi:tripeptidyl-peptidase-1
MAFSLSGYTTGTRPGDNEPFLVWLTNAEALSDALIPKACQSCFRTCQLSDHAGVQVFSVSYGDDEPTIDLDYANRVNTEFQKMSARGVTIFLASGDSGLMAASLSINRARVCLHAGDSGVASNNDDCPNGVFVPSFPTTSPWSVGVSRSTGLLDVSFHVALQVGATQGTNPEVAADFSGGGFSNFWAQPAYQV